MTEVRHDGMTEKPGRAERERSIRALLLLQKAAVVNLRRLINEGKTPGISWDNPFVQLEFDASLPPDGSELPPAEPGTLRAWTRSVLIRRIEPVTEDGRLRNCRVILPAALKATVEGLPESEREERTARLAAGFRFRGDSRLPGRGGIGEAYTPAGRQAQVDFARFVFPWGVRYALLVVLGYSRLLWCRFRRLFCRRPHRHAVLACPRSC